MYGRVRNMDHDIKLYGRSHLHMTMGMATAKDNEKEYEILQAIGGGILVRAKHNKNEFELTLNGIMKLAIDEGLDKDAKEIYTEERIKADREQFEKDDKAKEEREKERKKRKTK